MSKLLHNRFMEATRGVSARRVAVELNKLTPGTNWYGQSKGYMAKRYAVGDLWLKELDLAAFKKACRDR